MKYATVIVSILIIIAVLVPGSNLPDVNIGSFDKVVHVAMFTAWAVAVRYDFDRKPFPWPLVLITGIVFSGFTEVLQLLVEGRSFDVYDMAADTLGLIAGLLLGRAVVNWINRIV
jgi:VanZ family protein